MLTWGAHWHVTGEEPKLREAEGPGKTTTQLACGCPRLSGGEQHLIAVGIKPLLSLKRACAPHPSLFTPPRIPHSSVRCVLRDGFFSNWDEHKFPGLVLQVIKGH